MMCFDSITILHTNIHSYLPVPTVYRLKYVYSPHQLYKYFDISVRINI